MFRFRKSENKVTCNKDINQLIRVTSETELFTFNLHSKHEPKIVYLMNYTNIGNTCYMIHLISNLIPYIYAVKIIIQPPDEINCRQWIDQDSMETN